MTLERMVVGALALVFSTAPAVAQSGGMGAATPTTRHDIMPNTTGTTRGLSQLNNSGQVGEVTLTEAGADSTKVLLHIKSTTPRPQGAKIVRDPSGSCNNPPSIAAVEFKLNHVDGGGSTTTVPISKERLLSGNYFVIGYSDANPSHYFSCGRLFDR